MDKNFTQAKLYELMQKSIKGLDLTHITDQQSFTDLGMDSLDVASFLMAIDEEFGINIPDKDIDQCYSVASTLNYLVNAEPSGWSA